MSLSDSARKLQNKRHDSRDDDEDEVLLPTSGVLDLHRHAGLLVNSLGLAAASFVFLLCKDKKKAQ